MPNCNSLDYEGAGKPGLALSPKLCRALSIIDLKVLQGKAPSITLPSRLPLLWVEPTTNVGVALMLCSDASERLALIIARVASLSMQASSDVMFRPPSAAIASTPLQLRQFCLSNKSL